jgi:hypothetical protein
MIRHFAAIVAALGCVLTPELLAAVTLRVPSEYATLNAGLDAASPGDTVLVAPGTYSDWETRLGPNGAGISSCAHLSSGVTLLSEGGPDVTTIDMVASGSFPTVVWGWNLAQKVRVEGFTITSPLQLQGVTGANLRTSAKGTFEDCVFRDLGSGQTNETALLGTVNDLDVVDCKFINIDAGTPSAISQGNAKLYVEDCWFENCRQVPIVCKGGTQSNSPTATIRNSVFLNNYQSNGGGGAIYIEFYDPVEVSGCRFEGNVSTGTAGAFQNASLTGTVSVHDNVFLSNHANGGGTGGALYLGGASITVERNTFVRCTQVFPSWGGSAVVLEGGSSLFSNNVVAECSGGTGAVRKEAGTVTSDCNVFWMNPGGDLDGIPYGTLDRVVDPGFCDPDSGDFTVQETSPCLPANSGGCGPIGGEGMGCGTVSVQSESWGAIKGKYRRP